jgi:glycosyltransferase involved in cell wall biosynthesis
LQLPTGARFVATIGQLGLRKGTEVALSCAEAIAADLPDVHWLVVGERTSNKQESLEYEALLHQIAVDAPLADRAHFLGSRTDVPQLLAECALLVHAARQEPLGRVLLEAAASGVAVVATDVGGTREIFPTEQHGAVLVPPDNRAALVNAVLPLLQDDDRRHALGRAGRSRTEAAFDIRDAGERLVAQYRQMLNR